MSLARRFIAACVLPGLLIDPRMASAFMGAPTTPSLPETASRMPMDALSPVPLDGSWRAILRHTPNPVRLARGTGAFKGAQVTEDQEKDWRGRVTRESRNTLQENAGTVAFVEERAIRLFKDTLKIGALLRFSHDLQDPEIDTVIKALRFAVHAFQWFHAFVLGPEDYLLGFEEGLAVDVIEFLRTEETRLGIGNLVDEYILHEALERTTLSHAEIVAFTRGYFERGDADPLNDALRAYVLQRSDVHREGRQGHETAGETEPSAVKKAQRVLREEGYVDLADDELTSDRFEALFHDETIALMVHLRSYANDPDDFPVVSVVARAMAELDKARAERFFLELLDRPDSQIRFAAARILFRDIEWKSGTPEQNAKAMAGAQLWRPLAAYGRIYPQAVLAALRAPLFEPSELNIFDAEQRQPAYPPEGAAAVLGELSQVAEALIIEALNVFSGQDLTAFATIYTLTELAMAAGRIRSPGLELRRALRTASHAVMRLDFATLEQPVREAVENLARQLSHATSRWTGPPSGTPATPRVGPIGEKIDATLSSLQRATADPNQRDDDHIRRLERRLYELIWVEGPLADLALISPFIYLYWHAYTYGFDGSLRDWEDQVFAHAQVVLALFAVAHPQVLDESGLAWRKAYLIDIRILQSVAWYAMSAFREPFLYLTGSMTDENVLAALRAGIRAAYEVFAFYNVANYDIKSSAVPRVRSALPVSA